jgi:dienelactone hydrolase
MKKRRRLRRISLGSLIVVLLAVAGFVGWAETPLGPDERAVAALATTNAVAVEQNDWIVFRPAQHTTTTGLIFYPGGRVDERSYAPVAQAIAERGFLVVVVPMPLNLAVLSPDRANAVMAAFSNIQHWAISGHSLGGAMACSFAAEHPDAVQGMILMGAYCSGADVSQLPLQVVSITGSEDGVINRERLTAGRALLPPSTQYVEITGGNHAQFGSYGVQPGDNPATISPEAQEQHTVDATVALLEQIGQ